MIYLGFYTSVYFNVTLICVQIKGKGNPESKPFEVYYFDADSDEPILYRCNLESEAKFAFDFILQHSIDVSPKECQVYNFASYF